MPNQTEEHIRDDKEQREAVYVGDRLDLELIAPLPLWNSASFVHSIKWNNTTNNANTSNNANNSIITCDSQYVSIYNLDGGSVAMTGKVKINTEKFNISIPQQNHTNSNVFYKDSSHITTGGMGLAWDPHQSHSCGVASNKNDLKLINTHDNRTTMEIKNIHNGCIRYVVMGV